VNISKRNVTVFLDDPGQAVMELASVQTDALAGLSIYVQDTDDIGIWARIDRRDGRHIILIRWDYVLTIDFELGDTKAVSLQP